MTWWGAILSGVHPWWKDQTLAWILDPRLQCTSFYYLLYLHDHDCDFLPFPVLCLIFHRRHWTQSYERSCFWNPIGLQGNWTSIELEILQWQDPLCPWPRSLSVMLEICHSLEWGMEVYPPFSFFAPNDKDKKEQQDRAWKHSLKPRTPPYIYELNTNTSHLTIC